MTTSDAFDLLFYSAYSASRSKKNNAQRRLDIGEQTIFMPLRRQQRAWRTSVRCGGCWVVGEEQVKRKHNGYRRDKKLQQNKRRMNNKTWKKWIFSFVMRYWYSELLWCGDGFDWIGSKIIVSQAVRVDVQVRYLQTGMRTRILSHSTPSPSNYPTNRQQPVSNQDGKWNLFLPLYIPDSHRRPSVRAVWLDCASRVWFCLVNIAADKFASSVQHQPETLLC